MALNTACKTCGTRTGPEDNDGPDTQPELCARCRKRAAMSSFEREGRALKVLAMVEVIDRNALAQDPPINPYDQAGRILLASRDWTDDVWEAIGVRAGYPPKPGQKPKPVSAETRQDLQDVYRGRATAPLGSAVAS